MSVVIKTLSGREIAIPVAADQTVLGIKQVLSAMPEADLPPVERQKLIHQGKVLADGQLISELALAPGTFVVLMVSKPVAVAAPRPPPPTPTPDAAPIPPAPPPAPVEGASADAAAVDGAMLQEFRANPLFPQLQTMVQADPGMLPMLIQQLGTANPRLLQAIERNQIQFITMLNEPVAGFEDDDEDEDGGVGGMAGLGGGIYDEHWGDQEDGDYEDDGMGDEDEDEDVRNDMQMLQVLAGLSPAERTQFAQHMGVPQDRYEELITMLNSLPPEALADLLAGDEGGAVDMADQEFTAAEQASITQLTSLGFTQVEVVQAFLACGRNVEMTANFLLEGGQYDDDEGDDA